MKKTTTIIIASIVAAIVVPAIILIPFVYVEKEVNEERNLVGFQEVQTLKCWSIGTWGKCRTKCVQSWVFDDGSKEFIKEYYKE